MRKGFIFSIDALLAIALIVSASLAFVFLVPKADSELLNVQMLRIKTKDSAIVSFYTGTAGSPNSNLTSNASIGYCAQKFKYNLALPSNNVEKEYYCEEN